MLSLTSVQSKCKRLPLPYREQKENTSALAVSTSAEFSWMLVFSIYLLLHFPLNSAFSLRFYDWSHFVSGILLYTKACIFFQKMYSVTLNAFSFIFFTSSVNSLHLLSLSSWLPRFCHITSETKLINRKMVTALQPVRRICSLASIRLSSSIAREWLHSWFAAVLNVC